MLNIQKVKGILSARNGAQIPKFQFPAGALTVNDQIPKELQKIPEISVMWSTLNDEAKQRLIDTYKASSDSFGVLEESAFDLQRGADSNNGSTSTNPSKKSEVSPGKDYSHLPLKTETDYNSKTQKLAEANKATLKQMGASAAKGVGIAADVIDQYLKNKYDYSSDASSVNGTGRQAYNAVANSLMSFGPVGTVAGGAMKVLGTANDAFGKTTDNFTADTETINQIGGSYGGSVADIDDAVASANKKYGLLDGSKVRKANAKIKEARRQQSVMKGIANNAADMQQSQSMLSQLNAMDYQYQLDGGYDQRYMRAAKEGAKIQYFKDPFKVDLSDVATFQVELSDTPSLFKAGGTIVDSLDNQFIFKVELSDISEVESFKKGGSIPDREIEVIETNTTQKSVIPEGALHKNKHHLDEVGVDDSELTKKGIPVVDNSGDQQAEIELNEIIFTLEVTKELESRYKEFYEEETSQAKKDELAIEAGKLLWKEILYNTDDRTGLIDTLKQGGIIKAQEGTEVPIVSLEDFIKEKIKDRTEQAIQKATTRKIGYKFKNPNWSNCIATATDNYGVPIVIRNSDLVTDPNKYGFEELQFNSIDDLPEGALIQDYNKPKDTSVPGHTIMYVGLSDPDKEGRSFPLYSYSSGKSTPEAMHNYAKYSFMRWDDKIKPRAYRYIGTPTERSQWEEEYYSLYPSKKPKHQQGGSLNQSDINKMVKQALINILTND